MNGGIRVGVLDDHPVVREGLRALLAATGALDGGLDAAPGEAGLNNWTRTACAGLLPAGMLPRPWTGAPVFMQVGHW